MFCCEFLYNFDDDCCKENEKWASLKTQEEVLLVITMSHMYYTKEQRHYMHERREHDNALGVYAIGILVALILAPVLVYFYHVLSNTTFKIVIGLGAILLISNITAKLLYHFFENYEQSGKDVDENNFYLG